MEEGRVESGVPNRQEGLNHKKLTGIGQPATTKALPYHMYHIDSLDGLNHVVKFDHA
jgi:hypothetical protein